MSLKDYKGVFWYISSKNKSCKRVFFSMPRATTLEFVKGNFKPERMAEVVFKEELSEFGYKGIMNFGLPAHFFLEEYNMIKSQIKDLCGGSYADDKE